MKVYAAGWMTLKMELHSKLKSGNPTTLLGVRIFGLMCV